MHQHNSLPKLCIFHASSPTSLSWCTSGGGGLKGMGGETRKGRKLVVETWDWEKFCSIAWCFAEGMEQGVETTVEENISSSNQTTTVCLKCQQQQISQVLAHFVFLWSSKVAKPSHWSQMDFQQWREATFSFEIWQATKDPPGRTWIFQNFT